MLNFKRPCEVPSRHLANTTSSRPARSCSGPFDGGDDALGEVAGEGDREIAVLAAIGQPMARADHHRITKSFRQPMLKNVNAPAHDKNDNGGDHEPERRVLLCFPCVSRRLCIEVLGNNQNCLASSTACLFPASIMSTARPSQVCSTVRVTTLRTPMNRSQNST